MIKLLRADLYRMFKSRKIYIFIGLAVMLSIFMALIQTHDTGLFRSGRLIEDVQAEYMNNNGDSAFEIRGIGNYIIESGLIILFLSSIFISVFAGKYFDNGTLRNITVSGHRKETIFFSVFLLNLISTTLITLSFLISTVVYVLACGLHPVIWWPYILIMLAVMFLLELSFTSLITCILFVLKKTVVAVIATIVLFLVFLLAPIVGYDTDALTDYWQTDNIAMILDVNRLEEYLRWDPMFDDKDYKQYYVHENGKKDISTKTWDDLPLKARAGITYIKSIPLSLFVEYNTLQMNPYVYVDSGMALRNTITGFAWLILTPIAGVLLFRKTDIM